jgi:hypothetical protein
MLVHSDTPQLEHVTRTEGISFRGHSCQEGIASYGVGAMLMVRRSVASL